MNRIKISKNFYLDEFICPEIYKTYGPKSVWFLRKELIIIDQLLRKRFGFAQINTWGTGGGDKYSGLRPFNCHVGANLSLHKFGGASDSGYRDATAEEVRVDIIKNWKKLYKPLGLTTIEGGVNWLHKDTRYIPDQKELFIVYP